MIFPAKVSEVAQIMARFASPWLIGGGWAIDLFLGHETRAHQDIEIVIFRPDQQALRLYLAGWQFQKIIPRPEGGLKQVWAEDEWLELPTHEAYAERSGSAPFVLEILLNERSAADWKFRRNLAITRPLSKVSLVSPEGVPFLSPEIALLYKAKNPRAKDEQDFENTLPQLNHEQRAWLHQAIEICHPDHAWLAKLS